MEKGTGTTHLMSDVRSCIADVSIHLPHDADMLVAVEQRVLFVLDHATTTAVRGFVGFETRIGEHDNQPLRVFVTGCDDRVLFGDELR